MAGPPPDARLLKRLRDDLGWSIRRAARRADVSDGTWRNYESARRSIVRAADTLARMVQAVGGTNVQLLEAGRGDAAVCLQQLPPLPPDPEDIGAQLAEALGRLERVEREMDELKRRGGTLGTNGGVGPRARNAV